MDIMSWTNNECELVAELHRQFDNEQQVTDRLKAVVNEHGQPVYDAVLAVLGLVQDRAECDGVTSDLCDRITDGALTSSTAT